MANTNFTFPLSSVQMALFITFLHNQSYKHGTIMMYASGVAFFHKIGGHPDPLNSFLVQKAFEGLKKGSAVTDLRLPITLNILQALTERALPQVCSDAYEILWTCHSTREMARDH